ncbi:MAG: hypothetical protein Q9168_006786 [Polycauliona sp. 1 TL-2023]
MHYLFSIFSISIALAAASPTYQAPNSNKRVPPRVGNVVNSADKRTHHSSLVRRQDISATLTSITNSTEFQQAIANVNEPFANLAIWKEALDFDTAKSSNYNRFFYHAMGLIQKAENDSISVLPSQAIGDISGLLGAGNDADVGQFASKALQFLQFYPAQLSQSQASDPEKTLGKSNPREH